MGRKINSVLNNKEEILVSKDGVYLIPLYTESIEERHGEGFSILEFRTSGVGVDYLDVLTVVLDHIVQGGLISDENDLESLNTEIKSMRLLEEVINNLKKLK